MVPQQNLPLPLPLPLTLSPGEKNIGPAGFEPATCRRGDRTMVKDAPTRRDHVRFCNSALFLQLLLGSKSFRCGSRSMGHRVGSISSDPRCDGEPVHQRPHRSRHSDVLSSHYVERKHGTSRLISGGVISGRRDSNPRPLEPHSSALPSCATARLRGHYSPPHFRLPKKFSTLVHLCFLREWQFVMRL